MAFEWFNPDSWFGGSSDMDMTDMNMDGALDANGGLGTQYDGYYQDNPAYTYYDNYVTNDWNTNDSWYNDIYGTPAPTTQPSTPNPLISAGGSILAGAAAGATSPNTGGNTLTTTPTTVGNNYYNNPTTTGPVNLPIGQDFTLQELKANGATYQDYLNAGYTKAQVASLFNLGSAYSDSTLSDYINKQNALGPQTPPTNYLDPMDMTDMNMDGAPDANGGLPGSTVKGTDWGSILGGVLGAAGNYVGNQQQVDAQKQNMAMNQAVFDYQKQINALPLEYRDKALAEMWKLIQQGAPTYNPTATPTLRTDAGLQQFSYDPATILANSPDLNAANTKALETIRAQAAAGTKGTPYGSGNMYSAEAENLRAGNMGYLGQVFNQGLQTNQNNNNLRQQGFTNFNSPTQQMFQNQQGENQNVFNAQNLTRTNTLSPYQTLAGYGQASAQQLTGAAQNLGTGMSTANTAMGTAQGDQYTGLFQGLNQAQTGCFSPAQQQNALSPQTVTALNTLFNR